MGDQYQRGTGFGIQGEQQFDDRLPGVGVEVAGGFIGEQQRRAGDERTRQCHALLFADEPTGNLDTHTGQAIIELLFALNADAGTTLVLVTHDDHLAARCQRLLRLDAGRLQGGAA